MKKNNNIVGIAFEIELKVVVYGKELVENGQ